jgi:hypothetical protein
LEKHDGARKPVSRKLLVRARLIKLVLSELRRAVRIMPDNLMTVPADAALPESDRLF